MPGVGKGIEKDRCGEGNKSVDGSAGRVEKAVRQQGGRRRVRGGAGRGAYYSRWSEMERVVCRARLEVGERC
jgi:hypothetical protein